MTVGDLKAHLERFDERLDVLCYSEDTDLLPKGHEFRVLEITDLDTADTEEVRDSHGTPSLKFTRDPHAKLHVLINVTSDF